MVHVGERRFWDKARLLVTDACNYRCAFCHNEGQDVVSRHAMMSAGDAIAVIDALKDTPVTEIQFSGGEPFTNDRITDMILYADSSTDCDLGCATNLSLATRTDLEKLRKTRVKFNVQFPYADPELFRKSTGGGDFNRTVAKIETARELGIAVGLNTVIQRGGVERVEDTLLFALERELPLKLLPQIGLEESVGFKDQVCPLIERYATSAWDKGTGAIRWTLEWQGHHTSVLYIDSPCFARDFERCRNYGEVRIMPAMQASSCLLGLHESVALDVLKGTDHIRNQLEDLWNDFNRCS